MLFYKLFYLLQVQKEFYNRNIEIVNKNIELKLLQKETEKSIIEMSFKSLIEENNIEFRAEYNTPPLLMLKLISFVLIKYFRI